MFEKKRGKRFLASVMALVMLLSLAPVGALAADGETLTNEECSAMPLPANEANPKPVVTDEGNTANTNEEPTPPPRNEGDTIILTDNNNTSTAISEAEIIPEKELIDEAFSVDSKEEIQQYGSKENGNAVVQYSVSGSNTVKVGETITLTCNNKLHWPSHNWYTFGNSVAVEGDTKSNTITVKGLKEGTATVYCSGDSKQINVTDPQYVIRFYVSGTGTEGLYTEQNKYSVAGQPNSTFEDAVGDNPLELSVSAGYAILTDYNDTAKNITTDEFTSVNVNGDAAVREWLTTYANRGVQDGLTNRNNVETIVANVNKQYTDANNNYYKDKGITLPLLKTEYYNGFRFVNAYYVPSGESTIHVNVQLVKNTEYIVRYEPNGGAGDAYEDSTLYLNGQQASVKSNTFTKVGYTFNGWNTKPDGSGNSYQSGNTITIEKANVTLYAQWKAKEYEVKYDLNYVGATEEYATKEKVHWENDKLLPTTNPTRTGYEFKGWYTATENGTKVEGTTKYSEIAENDGVGQVTLYAYWTANTHKVTYTDGANGTAFSNVEKTGTYGEAIPKYSDENAAPKRSGYTFKGWTSSVFGITPDSVMPDQNVTFTATWQQQNPSPDTVNYTINKHFKGNKGNTIKEDKGTATLGTKNATLDSLITSAAVNQIDGENKYVYVSGKTTYTVGTGENKKTENLVATATLTEDTTIDLYYYLDNWKDGSSVKEDNEKGGDGIPDCDQVLIKYVSSNSERGTVSPDMEVLTLRKDNENVQIKINGSKATDNGGRNYFSNWTDEVNNKTINDATLTADTIKTAIETAEGGETYTFTANFDRSSGGGSGGSNRPKPPVVEIPDDVPTGLNGKDHYAYIIGYGNNDVRPQNNITRAEVATIFFRLLTDETRTANMTKSNSYNDVKDGDWFCCAVSTLSKMGIIKGYEDGSFKPNDPISRAEFAAIAARFDPDGDKTPATFADVTSHWAKDEISIAANHGWIKGYEDGSFKPDQKITRAETMTLVNRVLNRLPETKDDLHKDMKTWVDNMDETAWYYLAVQEATNSHYFKNKTSTKFEQWTDLRDTRDWSELEK